MRYRKLRIGWSVAWGVVVVLLILLWVRSFRQVDILYGNIGGASGFKIQSIQGWLNLIHNQNGQWGVSSHSLDEWAIRTETLRKFQQNFARFSRRTPTDPKFASVPHWILVLVTGSIAGAVFAGHFRFSLRTLLIATTLIAVVLGIIVYAVR